MLTYQRIGRPAEAHGVLSPSDYLAHQAHALSEVARLYPARGIIVPTRCNVTPSPIVSGGRWVVVCGCNNAPSYDPDWQMAACLECGAIYLDLAPPDGWPRGEALLMARPSMSMRHWLACETVDDLARQNAAHGHAVAA